VKIFGTGWQRTGTTSLGRALAQLGIPTLDFPHRLFDDLDDAVIHEYQAFVDNPIPLLYRDLDRRHPGSRFVHTERDDEAWLTSVEWLFTVGRVKFGWHRNPIFDRIHEALYGVTEFEPSVFLERYRRHNREVREHFADRPGDLLILDVTRGSGFPEICDFLGITSEESAFPHLNRRESILEARIHRVRHRLRGWIRSG